MQTKSLSRNSNVKRLKLSKTHLNGIHSTIRRTLLFSRIMGLLPLAGLTREKSDKLRFTFRSLYTIYYASTLLGQCCMFIASCYYLAQNGLNLSNFTNSLFFTSSLISLVVLMNIGRHWPSLVYTVESIEKALPPFNRNVSAITTITMILTLIAAAVEHIFSIIYGLKVARLCNSNTVAENYFKSNMPWVFDYTPFTIWKGLIGEFIVLQATFIWSFNDLFTMVISIHLTEHFLVHNQLLEKAVTQENFNCSEFRTQYLKIVKLVKLINSRFGIYIVTSFGSNLYWICTQLFYSLSHRQTGHFIACKGSKSALHSAEHYIYFTYSFSFLVARTLLVLLLAARIHSNSITPLYVLYDLPSHKFNIEADRYISQIKSLKIAMSGLEFFHVTRTMILTLLGTIVTYELVLLQFSE